MKTTDWLRQLLLGVVHPDHVGGLSNGDKLAFPNAIVRADKCEARRSSRCTSPPCNFPTPQ